MLARLHLLFDTESRRGEVHIWCIFYFDPNGLVVEIEEMLDTASAPPLPSRADRDAAAVLMTKPPTLRDP